MIEYTVKVYSNGDESWYLNGKPHREDGPAIEWRDGYKSWYLNGERHREDGPAIEYSSGRKEWYLNGEKLTEEDFNSRMNPAPSCNGKVVTIDGKQYKLTEVE
jgi:hypothetical protein